MYGQPKHVNYSAMNRSRRRNKEGVTPVNFNVFRYTTKLGPEWWTQSLVKHNICQQTSSSAASGLWCSCIPAQHKSHWTPQFGRTESSRTEVKPNSKQEGAVSQGARNKGPKQTLRTGLLCQGPLTPHYHNPAPTERILFSHKTTQNAS